MEYCSQHLITQSFHITIMLKSYAVWNIEHTDTFGGEPNYCWCNRSELAIPETYNQSWIVRKVKEQLGWTGLRCSVEDWGSYVTIRPTDRCEIAFATRAD